MKIWGYRAYKGNKKYEWIITSCSSKKELIKEIISFNIDYCDIAKMRQLKLSTKNFNLNNIVEMINEDLEGEYDDCCLTGNDDQILYNAVGKCINKLKLKINYYKPIEKTIERIYDLGNLERSNKDE